MNNNNKGISINEIAIGLVFLLVMFIIVINMASSGLVEWFINAINLFD